MSRRGIKTEDGSMVLLPGQRKKLCACGQSATRYCDFPKYTSRTDYIDKDGRMTVGQGSGTTTVLCAEPLCDRCAVEQPNEKDFCPRHAEQVKEMIREANQFEPISLTSEPISNEISKVIRASNPSINCCETCKEALKAGKGFCSDHEETVNQILENLRNGK